MLRSYLKTFYRWKELHRKILLVGSLTKKLEGSDTSDSCKSILSRKWGHLICVSVCSWLWMWKAQHVLIMQACLGPFLCQTPDNFGPLLPNESSRLGLALSIMMYTGQRTILIFMVCDSNWCLRKRFHRKIKPMKPPMINISFYATGRGLLSMHDLLSPWEFCR